MIHIVMGTKAQLIKMYPIIKELDKHGIPYNYIDTGQHRKITANLRKEFNLRNPDYEMAKNKDNINTNKKGILWMLGIIKESLRNHEKIFRNDKNGLCLVHGDTVSTFLGSLLAKFGKQKIVHIEAGFRSPKLLKPFPEEIIRRYVDKRAHINIAFKADGVENLKSQNSKAEIYNVGENTLIDMVKIVKTKEKTNQFSKNQILVSVHRYETIHSKKRMQFIVSMLNKLSREYSIVWGLHEPTELSLKRFKLYDELAKNPNIYLRGIFDYFDFIATIKNSLFLITDGGGPQDECKYLNVPCLLMRTENEKQGYGNVYQCNFKEEELDYFLKNLQKFKVEKEQSISPSQEIVSILQKYL